MPRYKLLLEYDGSCFCGWQRQDGETPSVQGVLEEAFFRFAGEKVTVEGAGRTDAGVHALGQVAHVDLFKAFDPFRIQNALQYHVRNLCQRPFAPLVILGVWEVEGSFHARFSACKRSYFYRILNRRPPSALDAGRVWSVIQPLSVETMQEAASYFVGTHDFTSFRDSQCQAHSPIKTLDSFVLERRGEEIHAHITARSFLHHQIRIMMGTLKKIGEGKMPSDWILTLLEKKDRRLSGPTAPSYGLYFKEVFYE